MKTLKFLVLFFAVTINAAAQCYTKIVSYSRNYIALQTDGTLWAKGTGIGGFLGFGNTNAVAEFTQIGTDNNWSENISLNGVNVFAIKTDGTLWVWGSNFPNGSAGIGSFEEMGYFGPIQVGTDNHWAKVSGANAFTLGVKTDGTLWAWGENIGGKLGLGLDDSYKTNIPVQVGVETNWSNVFTGRANLAYAIKTDGTLWAWGNNGIFIGYANATFNDSYRTPHQVGTDTWKNIAVNLGGPMTDGIKTDGSLWGWGASSGIKYLFGNGIDVYSSQVPVRIGNANNWTEVCIGQAATIALKTDGTRWGWGRNGTAYNLGMGSGLTSNVTLPTQLDADTDWKSISFDIYSDYGDGIKQSNTLYHWGNTHTNLIYPSPTLFSTTVCILASEDFKDLHGISISPNPVTVSTVVKFDAVRNEQGNLIISNGVGQIFLSDYVNIVNGEFTINLSGFASGVYFVTLSGPGYYYKTKIIKTYGKAF